MAIVYMMLIGGLKAVSLVYDVLSFIPSFIIYRPMKKLRLSRRIKAKPVVEGDHSSPWRSIDNMNSLTVTPFEECCTVDDLFERAVLLYGDQPCLGTRELLREEDELQPNGRIFKKVVLGEYKWDDYNMISKKSTYLGWGLLSLDLKPDAKICIFAETRAEWIISALACFKFNLPVVTIYATLGQEGMVHGIGEGECPVVITSTTLLPKLQNCLTVQVKVLSDLHKLPVITSLSQLPHVQHIVYMDEGLVTKPSTSDDFPSSVQVHSISKLQEQGKNYPGEVSKDRQAKPSSIAVIMYTSGTTGKPKGVMISNKNMLSAMSGQVEKIPQIGPSDTYIAYLPLAHVLELAAELGCVANGVNIGYSSPLTLTDTSSKIKKGSQGDATVLKPTLLAAVPAIMDRIYKAVWGKVKSGGSFSEALFTFAYEYKKRRLRMGFDTPIFNSTVFKPIRMLLGGEIRMILSGGAPLSADTQRFMNICFCCPVGQGYGLTETCGAGTIQEVYDMSTGRVGAPLQCNEIRLRDWNEAGYTTQNEPPQGEILIGGGNVTMGYYKNPEKTREDYVNINGIRYFCTGDIGECQPDGCLKIIDRKKDLLKLQTGEYVSLGKVETALQMSHLVDNICVYGDSFKDYVIALVVPKKKALEEIAAKLGLSTDDWQQLCANKLVGQHLLQSFGQQAKSGELEKFEIPRKIHICHEEWTSENGVLTDALKLKRKVIREKYRQVMDNMLSD